MGTLQHIRTGMLRRWGLIMAVLALGAMLSAAPVAADSAPGAPAYTTLSRSDGALKVTWAAVDGAAGYHVNITDDGGASWSRALSRATGTSATITDGIDNAKTYTAAVQAYNQKGLSDWTNSAAAGPYTPPTNDPPAAPASVTVTRGDFGDGVLNVSWPAVTGAAWYNVRSSDDGGQTWDAGPNTVTGTSATVSGVNDALPYHVAVQAGNTIGSSGWTQSALANVECPDGHACITAAPGSVSSVTVTRGDGVLNVSWPAADGATSYNVNTTDNGKTSWSRAKSGVTGTSTTITGVTNSKTYYVAVQAVNANGNGGWTDSAAAGPYTPPSTSPTPTPTPTATPAPAPPATPASVTVTRSDETLHASWPAVTGATGYHVTFTLAGDRGWVAAATNHPTTSIDIKHVLNVSSYIVGVRALNSAGGSGWRNSAPTGGYLPPGGLKPLPDAPSSVTVTRGDGTLTASWPAANNATSYTVSLKDNSDDTWGPAALFHESTTITLDASNYLDYTASVRSHNGTGDSYSKDSAVSAATATLLPPSYVAVTRGDGTLSASWAPADGATAYHVGWSDNNGQSWHRERDSYTGTTIDFTVPTIDNNKSYGVNVMSVIGDVQSVWRYSDFAPPYVANPPTQRPAMVTVTRSNGTLHATWDAVPAATGYHVTYSSDGGWNWSLGAYDHNRTSLDISGVDNAKTYTVAVRGINVKGGGPWRNSPPAGPYVPAAPTAAPANLAVAPGSGFLGITWDAVDVATGYDVRAKSEGAANWHTVASNVTGTSYNYTTSQTMDYVGVRARNVSGAGPWAQVSRLPAAELLSTVSGEVSGMGGLQMAAAMSGGAESEVSAQSNQVSGQSQLTAPVWGTIDRDVNRFKADIDLNWTHTGWATGFNLVCSDTDGWTWNVCGWDDDGTVTYTSVPTAESRPVTVTHYRRGSDSPTHPRRLPPDGLPPLHRRHPRRQRQPEPGQRLGGDADHPPHLPAPPRLHLHPHGRPDHHVLDAQPLDHGLQGLLRHLHLRRDLQPDLRTLRHAHQPGRYGDAAQRHHHQVRRRAQLVQHRQHQHAGHRHRQLQRHRLGPLAHAAHGRRQDAQRVRASRLRARRSPSRATHGNWWYKGRVRLGTYGTCTQVTGSTSTTLSTLTASTAYEYRAYSATGCAAAQPDCHRRVPHHGVQQRGNHRPDQHHPDHGAGHPQRTCPRLVVHPWHPFRRTPAPAPLSGQTRGPPTTTVSLANLEAGTSYTFTAYSDSTCGTEITNVSFTTTAPPPALTAGSIRDTTAGLDHRQPHGRLVVQSRDRRARCTKAAGTTVSLTNLTASTSYTYTAYSANTCASGVLLDTVTFSTVAPPPGADRHQPAGHHRHAEPGKPHRQLVVQGRQPRPGPPAAARAPSTAGRCPT